MNKKYLSFVPLIILICFLGFICTQGGSYAARESILTDEELTDVPETAAETLADIVVVGDTSYTFPFSFTELKQNGWFLDGDMFKNAENPDDIWFGCVSETDEDEGFYVLFDDEGYVCALSFTAPE